jgi:mono/diheme cytochrome c family protein
MESLVKPFAAAVLTLAMISVAHADPFPKGDPKIGKNLVEKSCTACHVSLMGGDGSGIYTRPGHKVKNAQQLLTRIRACNTNVGAGWFADEEMNVAAYLNQNYYHFK